MNIQPVPVSVIIVGKRHREIDQDKVLELATSIEANGLIQPITVHRSDDGALTLVAGHHRLEAAKVLGWAAIDAAFISGDEVALEMAEIAENLHRAELTIEQRNEHIRRFAELLKEKEAEAEIQVARRDAPEIGYKKPPVQKKGIASKVAAATGLSKSTVNRALSEKKLTPKPSSSTTDEPKERAPNGLKELARAWLMASQEAREEFLERHDLMRKAKPKPPVITVEANKPAFRDIPPEKPDPATNAYAAAKNGDMRIIPPAGMPKDEEFTEKDIPDFLKNDAA